MISWILRIILILFVVRLVLRFLYSLVGGKNDGPRRTTSSRPNQPATREGGQLVRDPNCGTYVPIGRALRDGSGSNAVYFCSETCRNAWATRKAG